VARRPLPLGDDRSVKAFDSRADDCYHCLKEDSTMASPTNRDVALRKTYEYSVYVIELDKTKRRGTANPAVYVGQTALTPEQRLAQHMSGKRSSRHVRGHAVQLRPDLYEGYNPMATRAEAESKEEWLADRLRAEGYDVYSN
jgi:hypothetical protein